ncbi:MAG: smalltalk protein [Prevotella sp.]|nr:smalltalk protein [Prevotella sp.]MBR6945448.1 smalltalk protein [Prevotella sp.]
MKITKSFLKTLLQIVLSVLSAIATTLGIQSCI